MIDSLVDARHPVKVRCRLLGVSSPGYYMYKTRPMSPTRMRRQWLTGLIREVHTASRQTYRHADSVPALDWRNTPRPARHRARGGPVEAMHTIMPAAFGGRLRYPVAQEPSTRRGRSLSFAATLFRSSWAKLRRSALRTLLPPVLGEADVGLLLVGLVAVHHSPERLAHLREQVGIAVRERSLLVGQFAPIG